MLKCNPDRFWKFVNKTNTCWLWTGNKYLNGYGQFSMPDSTVLAHRMAFLLVNNYLPEKPLQLRHTCDVRACVNPRHLIVGTRMQNMQDAIDRKRIKCGEQVNHAKLKSKDINIIRNAARIMSRRALANRYGVTHATINAIVWGRTWRHVN